MTLISSDADTALDLLSRVFHTALVPGIEIGIDFGDGVAAIADGAARTVRRDVVSLGDLTATLRVSPPDLVSLIRGELDPRYALLFGRIRVAGRVPSVVAFCDALCRPGALRPAPLRAGLPAPTTDHSLARRNFEQFGYCVVENAMDAGLTNALRERIVDQAAAERLAGIANFDGSSRPHEGPNQRVWAVHNKGDIFLALLEHPIIDEFVPGLLGEHFLLSNYTANIAGPGGQAQVLHTDQISIRPPIDFAIGINMVFLIDEFTEANGGTRVVPGSHLREHNRAPLDIYSTDETVAVTGRAGSVALLDSRLWHGTGPNRTDMPRHGLLLVLFREWMRTHQNGPLTIHPSTRPKMSNRAKTMFGLRTTSGLGQVQGSTEGTLVNWAPERLVLEMSV